MVQFWFKQCIYPHIFYQWSAISHCHSSLWPWIYVQHSGSASAKGWARWQQASKVHLFDPSKFQASVESILWKPAFVLWPDRRNPDLYAGTWGALGFRVVTVVTRPWGVHFIPWGTLGRTKLQARYVHFLEKETSQPAVNLREFYYFTDLNLKAQGFIVS